QRRHHHYLHRVLLTSLSPTAFFTLFHFFFFFFKHKTAYDIGLGIPAEPLFRSLAGGAMSKLFGGGFLTASKQFRHGATSKSRSNTRSEERFSRNAETDLVCRLLLEKKKENTFTYIDVMNKGMQDE